jgi:hypothetical protein
VPGLPQAFKDVAFALNEPGEVSAPVMADDAYHLIQLVQRNPPQAVKFEDVKESVREQLFKTAVQAQMNTTRADLARKALATLEVKDPVLAQQYEAKRTQRETEMQDRDQINRQLERERGVSLPQSAAAPNRAESASGATAGAEVARPPATQSGSDTPDIK